MDLSKYRLPLGVLVVSMIVLAAMMIYTLPREKNSGETANLRFPTGTPLALGSVSGIQVGEQEFNTISVTGSGTASMKADEASVALGVQTENESASEAVGLNAELITEVIDAIKALGLTEDDMRTVSYSVSPLYSKDDYTVVVGYRVVNMIEVEVTDMGLIGKVIDAAAENGANTIQGVSFGLSDENQEELKRQAYLAALDDAEEKAELIAERLELNITGVLYVSESFYQPYQPYSEYRFAVAYEAAAPTPIIEGKLSVSVTVNIVYSFE